jgi:acyl-CoA synthetase (NDP forming)
MGSIAVKTHTAAISGKGEIWKGMFEQFNLIEVESFEQLLHAAKLIDFCGHFNIENVAVLSMSGGYGVIMVDLLEKHGIKVPPSFSQGIQEKIDSQFFIVGTSSKNPLDVAAQLFESKSLHEIINLALSDKKIDCLIMDLPSWYFSTDFHIRKDDSLEDSLIECFFLGKKHGKPLFPILQRVNFPEDRERVVKRLTEEKIPVFGDPLEFIPLLSKISKYTRKALNT